MNTREHAKNNTQIEIKMKHAIEELKNKLDLTLDEFCYNEELGNTQVAAAASMRADDYAQAIRVLQVMEEIRKIPDPYLSDPFVTT